MFPSQMAIRTRHKLSAQQDWLLRWFLTRLRSGDVETSELIAVLITIRAHKPGRCLLEWCDTIAHPKRDKGDLWKTGMALMHETQVVDRFFSTSPLDVHRIPLAVFEALVQTIDQRGLGISRLDLKRLYPGGYSKEEFLRELNFIYRRDERSGHYKLDRRGATEPSDLKLVRAILPLLERRQYGKKPLHYDDIHAELVEAFRRLMGGGAQILAKRKKLVALHFLCAFHQTEVGPPGRRLRNPCYLTVDFTSSEHLALSFAVYDKEESGLEQRALYRERQPARQLMASHTYARPYVVTDLTEQDNMDAREKDDRIWGTLFKSALRVRKTRRGHILSRVHPLTLPRQRRDIHFSALP